MCAAPTKPKKRYPTHHAVKSGRALQQTVANPISIFLIKKKERKTKKTFIIHNPHFHNPYSRIGKPLCKGPVQTQTCHHNWSGCSPKKTQENHLMQFSTVRVEPCNHQNHFTKQKGSFGWPSDSSKAGAASSGFLSTWQSPGKCKCVPWAFPLNVNPQRDVPENPPTPGSHTPEKPNKHIVLLGLSLETLTPKQRYPRKRKKNNFNPTPKTGNYPNTNESP